MSAHRDRAEISASLLTVRSGCLPDGLACLAAAAYKLLLTTTELLRQLIDRQWKSNCIPTLIHLTEEEKRRQSELSIKSLK